MLTLGVRSQGAPEAVRQECQELANKLGVSVETLSYPEIWDANSIPEIIRVDPERERKRMRIMFATNSRNNHNPVFLEDEKAEAGELEGSLRAATQEEIAILSNMLGTILAQRTSPSAKIMSAMGETMLELQNATKLFGPFHSAHEAYGVIKEEFRELEDEVFKNARNRNMAAMRSEACQLAAMAMRLMVDLC